MISVTITTPMDQVAQVREKTDLISLIAEFIPLKKIGRNFTALCPFHSEKSPSFVVSPERQIWHCFGCSVGGDCFSFLMQYERIEFPEALRILAKRAGVELKRSSTFNSTASAKEKIFTLNRLACEFYHFILVQHKAGEKARAYLRDRQIKTAVWETFMLGFAPHQGDALSQYLIKKKGYTAKDIVDAGLGTHRGDFFVNRIIFPIFDHRDNIIGFSGRTLINASAKSPKYINTRETLVYHKGDVFFGLGTALQSIKKEGRAIIVEGEFDVISCFQEGIANAVAIKGTAFTEQQALLISRFANKVSVCFDTDQAGQEAIKRSLPALEKRRLTTTVILPPEAKDADEAIRANPLQFKKAVHHDTNVYDYLLQREMATYDKTTAEGKRKITDSLLPVFNGIENEIVKEHYLKKLAGELDTSYESMARQLERIQKKEFNKLSIETARAKRLREEVLEEYLLALIVQHDAALAKEAASAIADLLFSVPAYERIFRFLLSLDEADKSGKNYIHLLPVELLPAHDICSLLPLPAFSTTVLVRAEILRVVGELQTLSLRKKVKEVGEKIKELERKSMNTSDDDTELGLLRSELSALVSKLQAVSSSPSLA